MQRSAVVFLSDLASAATYILGRCASMDLAAYLRDEDIRFAVERNFIVIGEAVKSLNQFYPAVGSQIEGSKAIIRFRNFIVHQYWAIDDEELWQIIVDDLPALQTTVAGLLEAHKTMLDR